MMMTTNPRHRFNTCNEHHVLYSNSVSQLEPSSTSWNTSNIHNGPERHVSPEYPTAFGFGGGTILNSNQNSPSFHAKRKHEADLSLLMKKQKLGEHSNEDDTDMVICNDDNMLNNHNLQAQTQHNQQILIQTQAQAQAPQHNYPPPLSLNQYAHHHHQLQPPPPQQNEGLLHSMSFPTVQLGVNQNQPNRPRANSLPLIDSNAPHAYGYQALYPSPINSNNSSNHPSPHLNGLSGLHSPNNLNLTHSSTHPNSPIITPSRSKKRNSMFLSTPDDQSIQSNNNPHHSHKKILKKFRGNHVTPSVNIRKINSTRDLTKLSSMVFTEDDLDLLPQD